MIYDSVKINGTDDALLDFNDKVRVGFKNDHVQYFDVKWNEVLLSVTQVSD